MSSGKVSISGSLVWDVIPSIYLAKVLHDTWQSNLEFHHGVDFFFLPSTSCEGDGSDGRTLIKLNI